MSILNINPSSLYDGSSSCLSHARVDTKTGLVFVSGQVDWDSNCEVKNIGIDSQAESAMQNLLTVLDEAGSSVVNLLQLRIYVRGEVSEHLEKIAPVLAKYLGTTRPAITGVGVASLASPQTLIEIEAVAKTLL
ncbi:RidA family protein [Microbulbifer sp. JMSA003]|uniref:RidA family protein n=1 Tax=Microbulbifer sp. JMSA003 TaxID=3243369 RepID=UPI004039B962